MTAPQLRLGDVTLRTVAAAAQLRLGDVTLTSQQGAQLRLGDVTLSHPAAPTVAVALNPTGGNAPLTVLATTTATDPQNYPLSYSTNFGDGSAPVLGPNPTHTYSTAGTYTVTTTVTSSVGLAASATATATVIATQRRIFAVLVGGQVQPLLFRGRVVGGVLQPVQFDGQLVAGALVDPNAKV